MTPSHQSHRFRMENVPVDRLQPAPYNPRKPLKPGMKGYDRLKRSLTEFALVQPIVWNRTTGHVVSGHQRLAILRDEGVESLEVLVVELSLEREKALNLALNNHAVGSDWDADKLIETLVELDDLPEFDLELTGFDAEDLKRFVLSPDPQFEPGSIDGTEPSAYRVSFEVSLEHWEELRPALDEFLAQHELTIHIQVPSVCNG